VLQGEWLRATRVTRPLWTVAPRQGVRFEREVRAGRLTRAASAGALDMTLDDFLIEAGRHGPYAIDNDVEDFRQELGAISKGQY
jgi:hypothetical protein